MQPDDQSPQGLAKFYINALRKVENEIKPQGEQLIVLQQKLTELGRQAIQNGLFSVDDVKAASGDNQATPVKTQKRTFLDELKQTPQKVIFKKMYNPMLKIFEGVPTAVNTEISDTENTVKDTQSDIPYEQDLKRYGTDKMFEVVGQDPVAGSTYKDPFGNIFKEHIEEGYPTQLIPLPQDEKYSKIVYDYNSRNWVQDEPGVSQSVNKTKKGILDQTAKVKPLLENEQYKVYKLPPLPDETLEQRFERENVKRAGFNLPPLTEVPDWLIQTPGTSNSPIVVIEQKSTGEKQIVSGYFSTSGKDLINPSAAIMSKYPPNPESPDQGFRQSLNRNRELGENAPREIKEKLGLNFQETPQGPSWVGSVSFKDGTQVDTDKLVKDLLPEAFGEKETKPQITVTPVTAPSSSLERFNPFAQLGALGEILSGKKYEQDLGVKGDLPSGPEMKQIQQRINSAVVPAVGLVNVNPAPGESVSNKPVLRFSPIGGLIEEQGSGRLTGGSGFHIGNGYMLTAKHVTQYGGGNKVFTITTNNKKELPAQVVYEDPTSDWAVLKVQGFENSPSLKLGDSTKQQNGRQYLVAVGYPGSEFPVMTQRGTYSKSPQELISGREFETVKSSPVAEFSGGLYHGQSGGAIVDKDGNVVGIIVNQVDSPDIPNSQGGFVTINEIKNKLRELSILK